MLLLNKCSELKPFKKIKLYKMQIQLNIQLDLAQYRLNRTKVTENMLCIHGVGIRIVVIAIGGPEGWGFVLRTGVGWQRKRTSSLNQIRRFFIILCAPI